MKEYLFAYGLLKRKYSSNPIYGVPPMPIKYVGVGIYQGKLYRVAHYPGVKYDPKSSNKVIGDVYEVNNPFFLNRMDAYEMAWPLIKKFPEYRRVKRPVIVKGKTIQCWVYEYEKPLSPLKRIFSGDF
ncbi:gamma-glutamylcyclotransferase [Marinoscillum sp. MHG1-6]|uniref:gamma-glutamylcyclotransferase family protein n=1 Tax=Marinoscillum sp. MHG1-6 TaxID=2959627 RepID=UPI0021572E8B|nr:gamma-glutamylcyclotransferase family protein [Marinoscillum sp. MHG1-6]